MRGAGNQLSTNETDSELASANNIGGVSQWNTDADGFRLAQGSGDTPYRSVNESSDDYVAWNWKAHQTPSASATYTDTLTLTVSDYMSGETDGWGNTKLKVYEGTAEIGEVGQPTTDDGWWLFKRGH